MEIEKLISRIEALEKAVFKDGGESGISENITSNMAEVTGIMKKLKENYQDSDKVILQCIIDEKNEVRIQSTDMSSLIKEERDDEIIEICNALSSKQRITILKHLCKEELTSGQLSERTGLAGGHMHHHLRELQGKKLVEKREKGKYAASDYGIDAYLTVAAMNRRLRYDSRK